MPLPEDFSFGEEFGYSNLSMLLDGLQDLTPATLRDNFLRVPPESLREIFDHTDVDIANKARADLSRRLGDLSAGPIGDIDQQDLQRTARELIVLVDKVDAANKIGGDKAVEQEDYLRQAGGDTVQQNLRDAEDRFVTKFLDSVPKFDVVPFAGDETLGTHLYNEWASSGGGCNNVFASNMHAILDPMTRDNWAYTPLATEIRNHVVTSTGIDIDQPKVRQPDSPTARPRQVGDPRASQVAAPTPQDPARQPPPRLPPTPPRHGQGIR